MELYQLRAFAAVAEERHLTRAAERLHLSQPAVSGQIKALEAEFEVRLFDRLASGMELTAAGRQLLAQAVKVITAADGLKLAARNLKGEISGTLRLGTVSDPHTIRIGELLSAAVRRFPGLELELHREVSGVALENVRERTFDASFFFGDHPGAGFTALPLREVVYRVAAPASWAARVKQASWAEIAAMPWIVTPNVSTHTRMVTSLFAAHQIDPPQRHIEADDESVIVNLVQAGVGISLIREDLAREREAAGAIVIWPTARLSTTLWFVCLAENERDPLVAALLDLVRETWPASGSDDDGAMKSSATAAEPA
jgi:DNA-binding transcriptional LysR family regulator